MNVILTFLEKNRQRLALDRYGISGQMSFVAVTPRFRASSHVVFIVLPEDRSEPALVAKVPRLAGISASVEREVKNLRFIQAAREGGYDSIPRVVAFEEFRGHMVLVQTALVGRPMDPAAIRRDLNGCCDSLMAWLVELQRNPTGAAGSDLTWFDRLVEEPFRRLANVFSTSAEEARLLESTRRLVSPLAKCPIPLVFEHGDLSHPNILVLKGGGIGAVDWELAEPCGLPAVDLFFFLAYAAFSQRSAQVSRAHVPAFQEAFFGRAAWARPHVLSYAEQLGLPLESLTPLFVLCWARYLAGLIARIGKSGKTLEPLGVETVTWLRANRYYALWRYSLDHVTDLDWGHLPRPQNWSN